MRRKETGKISKRRSRSGFTLIELLVVVAIIAALMALTASVVMKFLGSQQQANTQSTLDRTQGKLNVAWSKVKDAAWKEPYPPGVEAYIRTNLAGSDSNATGRVRVIYVKLRLRQVFPMNFAEALNVPYLLPSFYPQYPLMPRPMPPIVPPSPLPPLPGYVTYLSSLGITTALVASPGYVPQPYESTACLLMALQRGQSGAGFDAADLTRGGSTGSFTTPNGKSLPFLTDAWNQPLFFSRNPVGNLALNPAGAQAGSNDPNDPQGYLQKPNWAQTNGSSGQFGNLFYGLTLQQLASSPPGQSFSYRIAPLLCSSGPDKTLEANPVTFTPVLGSDDQFSTPQ